MRQGRHSVVWMLSIGAALLAAASTAHVAAGRPGQPRSTRLAPAIVEQGPDLAAAIRDNAPLPVLLTDTPAAPIASESQAPPGGAELIEGAVEDVLYGRPEADPLRRAAVAQALKVLAHRLDLTRDVALGDRVRLVFRDAGPGARLDYVAFEGAAARVELFGGVGPRDGYVDGAGVPLDRFLLRTPLAVTRITSGFGQRLHPVLGYTRMHRGVDFWAATGTPVLAAGDGVVGAVGWDGGYGQRIVLRHAGAIETLYAHLSRIAPVVVARASVRQGQVIGWTGDTGQVTGPHLHFEVRSAGVAIDPSMAHPPAPALDRAELRALEDRKQMVARLIADRAQRKPMPLGS